MFNRIKKNLIFYSRILLKVVLCIQLCFGSFYGYSSNTSDGHNGTGKNLPSQEERGMDPLETALRQTHEQFVEENKNNPELPEMMNKIKLLTDLGKWLEEGRNIEELISKNPKIKEEAQKFFLFANQTAESIKYHYDSQQEKPIGEIAEKIDLSNEEAQPINILFRNIRVRYHEESKELMFEGMINERVVLRQRIPNMDIINYANDGEMLVLVDGKKGLLLVDMVFAESYLGKAPIPFTKVQVPVVKNLEKQQLSDTSKGLITVEFVNQSIRRPDTMPEYVQNIRKSFKGDSLFLNGDLMVSYTDSQDQKHLVQFLKRTELAAWLRLDHKILDMMINMVAPYLMTNADLEKFSEEKQEFFNKNKNNVLSLDYILSSFFTRGSIEKMIQAKKGIQQRVNQLEQTYSENMDFLSFEEQQKLSQRDFVIFREWGENFDKISERIQEKQKNSSGTDIFTTKEIVDLSQEGSALPDKTGNAEKMSVLTKIKSIRVIAAIYENAFSPVVKFTSNNKIELVIAGILAVPAVYFTLGNTFYRDSSIIYTATTLPHLVALGIMFPVSILAIAKYYAFGAEKIKKFFPKDIHLGKMLLPGPTQTSVQASIDKWKDKSYKHRLVGFGTKFVAFAILPLWIRVMKWMGQPHFFHAVQNGLNPLEKIAPHSDIGTLAGIKKDTYLGTQGIKPQWDEKSKEYVQHNQLQKLATSKQERIHSLAWLMSVMAITQKNNINPVDVLLYGISIYDLKEIGKIHTDTELQMEAIWVIRHLREEIKRLDEIDIRKDILNLNPKILVDYYKKAQQLVQEFRSMPRLRKKIQKISHQTTLLLNRTPLRNFHYRNLLTHNQTESEMLKKIPTDLLADRVSLEFFMDHMVVVGMPLVATDRSRLALQHLTRDSATSSNNPLFSSDAHLIDVWINITAHFFVASGQRSLTFTRRDSNIQEIFAKYKDNYESRAKYLSKTKERKNSIGAEFQSMLSYLMSGGKEGNFGEAVWKEYKARFTTWQLSLLLSLGMRSLLTEQTLGEMGFAWMMLNLLGGSLNIFWVLLFGSAGITEQRLDANTRRMEGLKNKLYLIEKQAYEKESQLRADYKDTVLEIVKLYRNGALKNKLMKSMEATNPFLANQIQKGFQEQELVNQSLEDMQKTARQFLVLISEAPPLPNKPNVFAQRVLAFLVGIVTSFIAIELSMATFNPDNLNWSTIGSLALIVYSFYAVVYHGYKKGFKEWKAYFRGQVLGLKDYLKRGCRGTFSK